MFCILDVCVTSDTGDHIHWGLMESLPWQIIQACFCKGEHSTMSVSEETENGVFTSKADLSGQYDSQTEAMG